MKINEKMMGIYRTADFGILPYNNTDKPLYNPKKPFVCIVFFTQSPIPLYFLAPPIDSIDRFH